MTIVVKETFDTYTDWVETTDSAYKSSFAELSERAKDRLNGLFDENEIDVYGPWNPDNVWVNMICDWSDKECLVDNLKFLTNDEYLQLVESGTLADYIKDKLDLIIDRLDYLGYTFLDHEKDEWTLLR